MVGRRSFGNCPARRVRRAAPVTSKVECRVVNVLRRAKLQRLFQVTVLFLILGSWGCAIPAAQVLGDETSGEVGEGDLGVIDGADEADEATVQSSACPEGRVETGGTCCWAGQMWSETRRACLGAPSSCPEGYVLGAQRCRPRDPGLGLHVYADPGPQRGRTSYGREHRLIDVDVSPSKQSSNLQRSWLPTSGLQLSESTLFIGYQERYEMGSVVFNPAIYFYPFVEDFSVLRGEFNVLYQHEVTASIDAHAGMGVGFMRSSASDYDYSSTGRAFNLLVTGVTFPLGSGEWFGLTQLHISRIAEENLASLMVGFGR